MVNAGHPRSGARFKGENIAIKDGDKAGQSPSRQHISPCQTPRGSPRDGHGEDPVLIEAIRAGDQDALGVLYTAHRAGGLKFARSLVRNIHDAQDVFHEAFTKTINAILQGAGPADNFPAYLYTAIRAVAAGWWRRHYRELPVETTDLEQVATLDPRLEALAGRGTDEHILTALRTLPERWQIVLWYADVLQQKPRHIAPLLGIAPNAVSSLVRRARKGLRVAYEHLRDSSGQGGGPGPGSSAELGRPRTDDSCD